MEASSLPIRTEISIATYHSSIMNGGLFSPVGSTMERDTFTMNLSISLLDSSIIIIFGGEAFLVRFVLTITKEQLRDPAQMQS